MDIHALQEMFPSLSSAQILEAKSKHKTEGALVSALLEIQERQGGVAYAGVPARTPHSTAKHSSTPTHQSSHVSLPHRGNVPLYWEEFWEEQHRRRMFGELSKQEAEHALFFDDHFVHTDDVEGKEEMMNVLKRLAKHPPQHNTLK
jgi:hypothetical protein